MSTRFSEVLGSFERGHDAWTVNVPDDWKQGRSVFGGLQSALALHAMRGRMQGASSELPLRVLQTTFVAPMTGVGTRVEARVLRAGKSTMHVEARLSEGPDVVAVVVGIFGAARPSDVRVAPRQPAVDEGDAPAAPVGSRGPSGPLPAFLQHFSMRWRRGGPPGSGTASNEAVVDVSLRDAGATSEEHVVALADAVPPHALSMITKPAFGSSLTWALEIVHPGPLTKLGLDGWRMDIQLVAAGDGYTSQSVMVWGPDRELVAISRQCMVVFG